MLDQTLREIAEGVSAIELGRREENTAASLRRQSTQQHIKELELRAAPPKKQPRKVIVTKLTPASTPRADRPTRSVLLLREARLAKIREVASKECMFLISPEYDTYLKEENRGVRHRRTRSGTGLIQ